MEKHRQKKIKDEKRERKKRERLDFDFPSQSDRRREKSDVTDHADLQEGGHFNFFAQFEKGVRSMVGYVSTTAYAGHRNRAVNQNSLWLR